jgi:predicted amidohydrolase YtcJ
MKYTTLTGRLAASSLLAALVLMACGKPIAEAPSAASTGTTLADDASADLVLENGEFHTSNGWAQAVAIKKGVLIEVGDAAAVAKLKGATTKVVDLKGAVVVPGLHDHHVHAIGSGERTQRCEFAQGSPAQVVLDTVKACVAKKKPGEWIQGGQWDAASLGDTPITHATLDAVSPDNPVALNDISMHAVWLNAAALKLANITKDTQPPTGGVIERDSEGEPTGVLRETARVLMNGLIPPLTVEQQAEGYKWSQNEMLKYGVTSFTDAGMGLDSLKVYALVSDRGELKQRVRGCIAWRMVAGGMDTEDVISARNLYARERFKPDCIKIGLDGVPTEGHTAAMLEPYADAKGFGDEARAKGILMVPSAELNKAVTRFDAMGLTVKMHAAGDAAVHAGLDAIAAARKANGFTGLFHNVSHNSFVSKADLARSASIQATYEMSPYIWYQNPIIPPIAEAIGSERMKRWTPVKEAIDSGALVVPGSDWAVVPSVNPWIAIETLVTRLPPGVSQGEPLGGAEKITLEQAFRLFTVNGARQMGNADKTGAIEKGLLADLVVIDRNPFKIPVTEIHATKVLQTYINGEVVYEAAP